MSCVIYVGDIGTRLVIDAGENITTATQIDIVILKPDNSSVVWTPCLVEEDTKAVYTLQGGDVDMGGKYRAQLRVNMPSWSGLGSTFSFVVKDHFQ